MPVEMIIQQSSADADRTLAESGFAWRERDGVKVLVSTALDEAGFANGFSTRLGGVSPFPADSLNLAGFDDDTRENIEENRRRFLAMFRDGYRLSTRWQVHGTQVDVIDSENTIDDTERRADALVSNLPGLLIGVKTADCVPILIADPVAKCYAAVHAGWRGTVESIATAAIQKLTETYSAQPANMIAAIGPAATCESYEVGEEVIEKFAERFPGSEKYFRSTREGHALVDLHAANRDQLTAAGLVTANVYTAPFCTMKRNDLFFSYRLESRDGRKTGRLMSVIGLAR
jgi:polyphenol oxidase